MLRLPDPEVPDDDATSAARRETGSAVSPEGGGDPPQGDAGTTGDVRLHAERVADEAGLASVSRLHREPRNPLFRAPEAGVSDPAGAADRSVDAGHRGASERAGGDPTHARGTAQFAESLIDLLGRHTERLGAAVPSTDARTGLGGRTEPGCDYGCPLCAAMTAMRELQPDTMEHFSAATREFVAAMRSFANSIDRPLPHVAKRVQRFRPDD